MEKPKVISIETREDDLKEDYEMTTKAFSPISDNQQEDGAGAWQSEVKALLDLNTLMGLYYNEDWVYILVDKIASKIAAQEIRVMKESFKDGEAIYEPVEDHPVQKLIYEPNENQTYYQWIYSVVTNYCMAGNAIVWHAKSFNQLIQIPIEMINIDFDLDGKLSKYRVVQFSQDDGLPLLRQIMDITREQVAHIRRPNPSSAIWGLSPFIPGRRSILFNRYSHEYLNNFYIKGAQPGMVFDMNEVANEKSALRLLRTIEAVHQGRKNQRRNMVLPKGVKASNFSHTLADQQLKDYIDQNRETIINILQVPKHELSLADSGSLGSEEYKTAIKNFWNGPLKSVMKAIEGSLTKLLKPELGESHYLEFDLTDVEVLQEDLNSKADLSIKLLKTHTLNEVRSKIFNEDPLEGGDALPKEQQAINPVGFSLPTPKAVEEPKIETPEEVKGEEEEIEKHLGANRLALSTLKQENPKWWKQRHELLQKNSEKTLAALHKVVLDLFADQVLTVIKLVRQELKRQDIKTKADEEKPKFSKAKLKRETAKALEGFSERWVNDNEKVLAAQMDLGFQAQAILPFGLKDPAAFEAARIRNEQRRTEMLNDRSYEAFKGMNQTTQNKIFTIIERNLENSGTLVDAGRSVAQAIVEDIGSTFTDPKFINSRAMTIARTEMLTATSLGQAAATEIMAETDPDLVKAWITMGDERVRGNPDGLYPDSEADHHSLEGEVIKWDEDFVDSKGINYSFPRDPKAPPEGIINCRCSFITINKGDAESIGLGSRKPEIDLGSEGNV